MTPVSPRLRLAQSLETLSQTMDTLSHVSNDPIAFPKRFQDPRDIEIVGWLAAALAYGRVPLFQAALERLLNLLIPTPYEYVRRFDPRRDVSRLDSWYYRMHRGRDIACLLYVVQQILKDYETMGDLFLSLYDPRDPDIGPALERFVCHILTIDMTAVCGHRAGPRGFSAMVALPSKGSACKRLNLFLRWMVRPADGLDFVLWKGIAPSKLIIPLDTHVLRISRYLGLTRRRTSGWTTAREITRALGRVDPQDPLRFDFPLCHLGISGRCPIGKVPEKCVVCPLLPSCHKGRKLVVSKT